MERFRSLPVWGCVALLCALACGSLTGCGALALAINTIRPNDIPAQFKGLENKRVVVVCRPVVELQFSGPNVPRELSRQVAMRLEKGVKKIKLVDEREIAEWVDENNWHSYIEVGKAMKADMVVGIDLEQFQLHQGPTLLQGQAAVNLAVIDVNDGGNRVFTQQIPSTFPNHTPIPISERLESDFRRQFLGVLAEQISRNFYPHDSHADFAGDANLQ
ncbi:MAG: hypothetical protein IT427_10905 [Pirellulales bacterium]|nr:hypothetical protein [Pirellulales bacterium]